MDKVVNPAGLGNSNGRYRQGVFKPTHPEKCINLLRPDKFGPPVYRSGYEYKFMVWADISESILAWGCEVLVIPYVSRVKVAQGAERVKRRYFTDFYLEVRDNDGKIVKYVIEVKPKKQTVLPTEPKRHTKKSVARYESDVLTYATNEDKWRTAERFCEANGMVFKLITEDHLFGVDN